MRGLGLLYAFLGGALVGASAAILFAPEKGSDLRSRIKEMLKKNGIDFSDDEVEQLVKQISAQILPSGGVMRDTACGKVSNSQFSNHYTPNHQSSGPQHRP